ncbi:MAG: hypothetical protein GW939_00990 [Candidatus Magasanikbacteria bacterium]|nr:hypothetical protein [Candidatus Magasanikbacteria bacterium]NCS71858.1 hypothetical protein [Candidatus Magasanikbacteria bacterium]
MSRVQNIQFFCCSLMLVAGCFFPASLFAKTLDHVDGTYISFNYPDNHKFGRIWIAPSAQKGTPLPLVIFYHGSISAGVANDDNLESSSAAYLGPNAKRRFDNIANAQILSGKIPPLVIAVPIEGTNNDQSSFTADSQFSFDELVNQIAEQVQTAGYTINRGSIILAGHSNGGNGFYNTLLDKTRQTSIAAAALIDTGMTGARPQLVEDTAIQKPTAMLGIGARNYATGAGDWIAAIKKVYDNDTEAPVLPCDNTVFASCSKIANKEFYYFQVDTRQVNDAHNEAVNIFFQYGLPLFFQGAVAANEDAFFDLEELQKNLKEPTPVIQIPGLSFSNMLQDHVTQEGNQIFISIPFLGEYMAALYRYGVVVAILVSIFMIIVSGAQLMLSGLSEDFASSAKKRITQALIGLFLTLGSYSLLYFINPQLVSFSNLKVLYNQSSGKAISSSADPGIGSAGSTISCDQHKYDTQQNVFAVGDSITVGIGTTGMNTAYGERLIGACPQLGKYDKIALGGKGTKPLLDALLPRDLRAEGFSHIIILAGINDITSDKSVPYITNNLEQLYKKAKTNGLRVIAVTISPFGKQDTIWTKEKQLRLEAVNKWIYEQSGNLVDVVIDFNQLIKDPSDPNKIAPQYDKDGIHPNDAAHALLAAEISRKAFR